MKPFNEWLREPEKIAITHWSDNAAQGLLEHNGYDCDINNLTYPCRVCEKEVELLADPHEFDPDNCYCGGSPTCCP